jgi:hypothetical protein
MFEINARQLKAVDTPEGAPPLVVDTKTGEEFVLVRRDVFEHMRRVIDGMTRSAGWDDPALDDYEQFRDGA